MEVKLSEEESDAEKEDKIKMQVEFEKRMIRTVAFGMPVQGE